MGRGEVVFPGTVIHLVSSLFEKENDSMDLIALSRPSKRGEGENRERSLRRRFKKLDHPPNRTQKHIHTAPLDLREGRDRGRRPAQGSHRGKEVDCIENLMNSV